MWRTPRLRNRKIAPMQRVFFEELVMCKMVFAMWLYLETVSDNYIKYTVKQQIIRQNTLFESIEYWLSLMTVSVSGSTVHNIHSWSTMMWQPYLQWCILVLSFWSRSVYQSNTPFLFFFINTVFSQQLLLFSVYVTLTFSMF